MRHLKLAEPSNSAFSLSHHAGTWKAAAREEEVDTLLIWKIDTTTLDVLISKQKVIIKTTSSYGWTAATCFSHEFFAYSKTISPLMHATTSMKQETFCGYSTSGSSYQCICSIFKRLLLSIPLLFIPQVSHSIWNIIQESIGYLCCYIRRPIQHSSLLLCHFFAHLVTI